MGWGAPRTVLAKGKGEKGEKKLPKDFIQKSLEKNTRCRSEILSNLIRPKEKKKKKKKRIRRKRKDGRLHPRMSKEGGGNGLQWDLLCGRGGGGEGFLPW